MPSPEVHLEQAQNNEEAARSIEKSYPDWAVTMYFYAALHWVEHYAKRQQCNIAKQHPSGRSKHDSRKNYVKSLSNQLQDRRLIKAYQDLEQESRTARYLAKRRFRPFLGNSSARNFYIQHKTIVTKSYQNLQIVKQLLR